MMISIKSNKEIEKMRRAGKLAAQVLDFIEPHVESGISTGQLDKLCHDFIVQN
ncbi:MAG TPA: type I methionyl aminopeptidase, partial [Patescibacteria group bacterium]|nr:type I methionyl aminopeptidase [Patescibacteria group bacterium]